MEKWFLYLLFVCLLLDRLLFNNTDLSHVLFCRNMKCFRQSSLATWVTLVVFWMFVEVIKTELICFTCFSNLKSILYSGFFCFDFDFLIFWFFLTNNILYIFKITFWKLFSNPDTAPTVLWLSGGRKNYYFILCLTWNFIYWFFFWIFSTKKIAGCSSELAMLYENGPYKFDKNGKLVLNPYSWNTNANVLYVSFFFLIFSWCVVWVFLLPFLFE